LEYTLIICRSRPNHFNAICGKHFRPRSDAVVRIDCGEPIAIGRSAFLKNSRKTFLDEK